MRSIPRSRSRTPLGPAAPLYLSALVAITGCGGGKSSPVAPNGHPTPTTALSGYYAGGNDGGQAILSISAGALARAIRRDAADTSLISAFATLSHDAGGTAVLSGSYDVTRDTLRLAGAGYTMTGRLLATGPPAIFTGSYEGPYGGGAWRCLAGNPDSIRVYCGSFESGTTLLAGNWHFLILGATLYGLAFVDGDSVGLGLQGSATGTGILRTIAASGGDGTRTIAAGGSVDTAVDQASGSWNIHQGGSLLDQGSWTADRCLGGTTSGN